MRQILVLGVVIGSAVFLGLALRTGSDAAAGKTRNRVFTGRQGDVFRVPSARVRCVVTQEGGAPELLCRHTPKANYSVVYFKDNLFVYRNALPDTPIFSARGKP